MKSNISIDDFVTEQLLKNILINFIKFRSILGKGFRESLDIIGEIVDLKKKKIKSGTKVLDWTVPNEWNIKNAYIISPDGKKFADFKKHNLHVVNYSTPVNKIVSLDELKKHLHTLPELPNAIPYVTSYYKRQWGSV